MRLMADEGSPMCWSDCKRKRCERLGKAAAKSKRIQGSTIEGVEIGLDSIQSYQYPVSRPLFFYVKKAHIGTVPGMKEYMSEFVGDSAIGEYGYLSDIGLVPLASDKLAKVRYGVSYLKTM